VKARTEGTEIYKKVEIIPGDKKDGDDEEVESDLEDEIYDEGNEDYEDDEDFGKDDKGDTVIGNRDAEGVSRDRTSIHLASSSSSSSISSASISSSSISSSSISSALRTNSSQSKNGTQTQTHALPTVTNGFVTNNRIQWSRK
jgi:hypothetical protein